MVLSRSKPSLLSPSKQRPCRPQVSSSSAVAFTAMRVNQLDFYISIVLAVSCSHSVFTGGQISAVPIQIYMVRNQILRNFNVCEHACLCMSLYCLCWTLLQVYDDESSFSAAFWTLSLSLNTLSCGVQLWQHWWAPLNCKPSFQLIGMSFWFKYPAWLITAADNTHNITLHYGSSGSYSD